MWNNIGPTCPDGVENAGSGRVVGGLSWRQERAALHDDYTGEFPTAEDAIHQAVATAKELLSSPERQFVKIGRQEAVTPIINDVSIVEAGMKPIRDEISAGSDERSGIRATFIRQVPCKRITALKLEAVGEPLVHFGSDVVVVADAAVMHALQDGPKWKGPVGIGSAVTVGVCGHLDQVHHVLEVRAVASCVRVAQA